MKRKLISLLLVLPLVIFFSLPAHGVGYEDANLFKIILKLIVYLFIFALVIVITIYGTRLISKSVKGIASSKYINLLDAINLPGGSKLVITKINKKVYILGISNSSINVVDTIEEDKFNEDSESFDNYLTKYLNKNNSYIDTIGSLLNRHNKKKDRENNNDEEKY